MDERGVREDAVKARRPVDPFHHFFWINDHESGQSRL